MWVGEGVMALDRYHEADASFLQWRFTVEDLCGDWDYVYRDPGTLGG